MEQAPANPPPMMETEMRDIISQIDQAINTQSQDTTVKAQAMKTHANRDISPLPYQQVTTMDSHLRDIPRMKPPNFIDLRLMKTLKNSSMSSTRYYIIWGCLQVRRLSWTHINSRILVKLDMFNGGIIGR